MILYRIYSNTRNFGHLFPIKGTSKRSLPKCFWMTLIPTETEVFLGGGEMPWACKTGNVEKYR